jgi:hypothetical protein
MTDRDINPDQHRLTGIAMEHCTILNIAASSDADLSAISPGHGRRPEAAALLHGHVSDHHCRSRHPSPGVDLSCRPWR